MAQVIERSATFTAGCWLSVLSYIRPKNRRPVVRHGFIVPSRLPWRVPAEIRESSV
jgi:hypothetical protein